MDGACNRQLQNTTHYVTMYVVLKWKNSFDMFVSLSVNYRVFAVTHGMEPVDEKDLDAATITVYIVVQYHASTCTTFFIKKYVFSLESPFF